ncbi:thiolase family protein [Nocardioides acrostichi]
MGALRTPVGVGKPGKGVLDHWHPVDLSGELLAALVARAAIDPALIDDVIWGCVTQVGEQSSNVGRLAALAAGFPESVVGTTIDRQCGSSQQAVHFAAAGVVAGHYDLVVAGGVESMSRAPMFSNVHGGDGPVGPRVNQRFDLVGQGTSAELIASSWGISRGGADELAVRSHERAAAATADGLFEAELVPVPGKDGQQVQADQGIRPSTSLETLAALRPAFRSDGVVTAGNSSQISDGAAALLITTSDIAAELGLTPLARIHTVAMAGVDPVMMLTGPIPATARVLSRSGLTIDDIAAFEVSEAFAPVVGAWLHETGADPRLTNPMGGAMAIGHPLGASGARLMTTLVHHLARTGGRYGLQTMCEGGGMANATIIENLQL